MSFVERRQEMDRVVAIVLGGGRGTRLYPLTAERAKPAVPLCGRYRLVDIPLSNCINSGIKQIFVLTQFLSASLHRHINNTYKFDIFSKGYVEVLAAEQTAESGDWFQGTADAVRKQYRHLRHFSPSNYVILSGDQLYRMDYRTLLTTHANSGADITVAVIPVTKDAAPGFGILKAAPDGRITKFVEKPRTDGQLAELVTPPSVLQGYGLQPGEGREYLASMGVYVFSPDVLMNILQEKPDWIDFGKDVIPKSLDSLKVQSHLFADFWEDIGTVKSYYDVSIRMAAPNPPFEFYGADRVIYTRPRYLAGSRLQDAVVKDSIVCEGSRIKQASISRSIIGVRTIVQPGVHIERSVVMGADYYDDEQCGHPIPIGIGPGSQIIQAIVDKNARIGKDVIIRGSDRLKDGDDPGWAVRDGIVVVLKNASIPDGTEIG